MKLYLKARIIAPMSPLLKTAANREIVPGKVFKFRKAWEFRIIGLGPTEEGWVMQALPGNTYNTAKDRFSDLVKQLTQDEYLHVKNNKKFPWDPQSRYFEFEFDHPIYGFLEIVEKPKFKPKPFVPQIKPKIKFIFTFDNGKLMPDQELKSFPRTGLDFVEKIQRILNNHYDQMIKKYPYPVRESSLPLINEGLRLRTLRPSSVKWKSQLIGISATYRFWVWAYKIIGGMHQNELISQEELEIGKKAIKAKFRLTQEMKKIFEGLDVSEEF